MTETSKTRKDLKADAAAAKAAAKSLHPWWRKKRFIFPAVIVVIIVIAVVASNSGSGGSTTASKSSAQTLSTNTKNPPAADVTVNSCALDSTTGFYAAKLTVVNHSSKLSDYTIEVSLLSADGATKYDTMLANVTKLAPGQSSPQTAQSVTSGVPAGAVCKVASVDRFASTG